MTRQSRKFTGWIVSKGQTATRTTLWLFVLFWASGAHTQEPPTEPAIAVTEQNAGEPANTTTSAADSADASPSISDDPPQAMSPRLRDTRFWLSGQMNFIFQTHPPFYAAYSGKNSLDPNYEKATSRVMTLSSSPGGSPKSWYTASSLGRTGFQASSSLPTTRQGLFGLAGLQNALQLGPDLRLPARSLQASLNDPFSLKAVARYGNPDEWDARFCKRSPHYLTSTEHCAVRLARNFLRHLEDHF